MGGARIKNIFVDHDAVIVSALGVYQVVTIKEEAS
jgi:hypothetical protein